MVRRAVTPLRIFVAVAGALLIVGHGCTNASSKRPQTLGVLTSDATISSVGGVLITQVTAGGAADQSGLQANDIIARLNGNVVTTVADLRSKISVAPFNQPFTVTYFRTGNPNPQTASTMLGPAADGSVPNVLGFSVTQGSSALNVFSVTTGGVAAVGGLQVNDQIISVNGSPTTALSDAYRFLGNLSSNVSVTLTYTRSSVAATQPGVTPTFNLTLTAPADASSTFIVPGFFAQDLTPTLAAHFGYITSTGAQITNLYRDTPAFTGGLLVGDILIGLTPLDTGEAEQQVLTAQGLADLVAAHAGENVELRFLRGQLPPIVTNISLSGVPGDATQVPVIGMLIEELSGGGLRVEQVTSSSPAATAGIARDDRILQVNNSNVSTLGDFWNALLAVYDDQIDDLTAGSITAINVVIQVKSTTGPTRFVVLPLAAAPT